MTMNSLPPDYAARQAALDPSRSFAVSAPAGSGKTGLLTQRVLKLLSLCDHPEEILAITFTRKAAGEMQDRILQALWTAKEKPQPQNPHDLLTWELATQVLAHDEKNAWHLLECPQRLRIQTIDSLSSSISRQLPIANGFGATPAPMDNPETAYREAVRQLFGELEKSSPLRDDLCLLLRHLDNNISTLETLFMRLLAKRDQWLGAIFQAGQQSARDYLEHVLQDIIRDGLEQAHTLLQLHSSELALIADWAASNLQSSEPDSSIAQLHGLNALPKPSLSELPQWLRIADFLLTDSNTFRKRLTKSEGFPAAKDNKESGSFKTRFAEMVSTLSEQSADAENIIAHIRELPPRHYSENQWQLLDALTRLLPHLAARLNIVFAEIGETDFIAISQSALTALGDDESPTDIALQLDYRIRHILVDEFQDTSSTQLELLKKLTAGWQPDDGRSLFIVGDGMQSCYSFRNANVGIFLEARKEGIGELPLEPLNLTVNFRSQAGIVDWVNKHFQQAFPSRDDIGRGAVSYSPSIAFKSRLDNNAVSFFVSDYTTEKEISSYATNDEDDSSDASGSKYLAELQENEAVTQLILHIRANHPNDRIALLARSRPHFNSLFSSLSRAGLSWQATDIDPLAQRMAIIDLMSLTRALLNPTDRIAWLAILRAPWCGLDLHDLHAVATTVFVEENPSLNERDFPLLWQQIPLFEKMERLSASGKRALSRFVSIIQQALKHRLRKPLRQWIEGIWLALGGPATLLDTQDIYDIPLYFGLLEQHQQGGMIKDWAAFQQSIKKLYATPRQDADSQLQVMTLHKSKGLEFDHVIIPRLHKTPANDDQDLLLWRERLNKHGERQLLLGSLAPTGQEKDSLYQYIKRETALQLEYEATRLFYVGCTRAIKHLYLFACLAQKEMKESDGIGASEAGLKSPPRRSLLSCIWSQVQSQIQITKPIGSTIIPRSLKTQRPGLQHILRLAAGWVPPALEDDLLLKNYRGKEYNEEDNKPTEESQKLARSIGTLIHRALQTLTQASEVKVLALKDFSSWKNRHAFFWMNSLKQEGFNADEINGAIEKIQRAIHNTLTDPQGLWLLDNTHTQSECELAIIHQQGNSIDLKLRENIIDRTFIDNGTRWIIDYKTSEPSAHQSIDDFIQQEIKNYMPQLARYQACFEALGETSIKTALFFPFFGAGKKLIELTDEKRTES